MTVSALTEPVNERPFDAELGKAQASSAGRYSLQSGDFVSMADNFFDTDQSHHWAACLTWITTSQYPTMKFFADSRSKRNTAFVVLLVWLFALASAVANACLLEQHETHATLTGDALATTSQGRGEFLSKLANEAGHHHDSDANKESCLKACDDGTRTLPKAHSGVDVIDPGPALLVTTLWIASHAVSAPRRADDHRAVPMVGPPLRHRFSRLAL